ncbi:putative rhodanese-related sulfurtransferase (multiple rhodanese domains) [Aliarcobacter cibarius]|uniref:rhodanese-like domain-containing protein n=1 Tax=Aliarcobacter cibarius TaxID=255507 RepID=UPI001248C2B4|nr:rhodanese-like domain-containing protein [Aliarcobacter cibarius]QEZ89960.1 putative rhodanese-related sulfurtransferase (multiple rhodanese domains) [Aliarcobacter cibarius]
MKKVVSSLLVASLLGFSVNLFAQTGELKEPTPAVLELIKKHKLEQVNFDYVKKIIGNGSRGAVEAILVDARPELKYQKGTIPSSINIPDTNFEEFYSKYDFLSKDKNKEIIVYCGGFGCEKSPIVADLLKKKGHKNVKVYSAGEPEWENKSYLEIGTVVIKSYLENNSALLVDARPNAKFMQETILGSISIPDTEFDKLVGRFPINKDEKIVTFCAGFDCEKSNIVAEKLYNLGYKNVSVYAGGLPEWKKAGLATTAGAKKVEEKPKEKKLEFSKNGVKLGADEGTVDGEWLKALIIDNKVPENIQIVNVLNKKEFDKGHIKGSINIEAEKLNAKELYEKLPKNKTIVFHCAAGSRSLEAWLKLKKDNIDISEIFYFDANVNCKEDNCKIDVNEPLG